MDAVAGFTYVYPKYTNMYHTHVRAIYWLIHFNFAISSTIKEPDDYILATYLFQNITIVLIISTIGNVDLKLELRTVTGRYWNYNSMPLLLKIYHFDCRRGF